MKKLMRILSILLIVSLVFVILQSTVLASEFDSLWDTLNELQNENTVEEVQETKPEPEQEVLPENNNVAENNTVANNTTVTNNVIENNTLQNINSNNNGTNENLPKTGVTEEYAIGAFAVICAVAAIFAFKKVKNYNV